MKRFRTRLILGIIAAIFFVLVSLGFLISNLMQGYYTDQLVERLSKEARFTATAITELNQEEWQAFADRVEEDLEVRVTILNNDGGVIGDSTAEASEMENHLERPEIQNAGEADGYHIRVSETSGERLLYYAEPFEDGYVRLAFPMNQVEAVNTQLYWIITASFAVAFIIISTIAFRIANQMTAPIDEVSNVARELAKGNFKARAYSNSKDEIGQLTRSMNMTAYNLDQITSSYQSQQERLEALIDHMGSGLIFISNRGDITLINQYCKDIFEVNTDEWLDYLYYEVIEEKNLIKLIQEIFLTEVKVRDQVQLAAASGIKHYDVYGAPILGDQDKIRGIVLVMHDISELKKLENVRKDFVANVSHELKTPVTSLKGFAETLLDGAMHDPELTRQFLEIIWNESDRLQDLISDLLELSRIEQEHFNLYMQDIAPLSLIGEAVSLLRPKIEAKSHHIDIQCDENIVMRGDAGRLKQVMINLVDNAISYTPDHGSIQILITRSETETLWKIQDSGIGIAQEEQPRIFERFYRVDKARSRNSGGTGLGLAIVKHLVEAHKGKIRVESQVGEGTAFIISFPFHTSRQDF